MSLFEKQNIYVYNSLSSKKEKFEPILSQNVGMYVCGPTVYSNVHLGNVRTFVSFDTIFRYLKHLGYKVRYVRNITDVGHLENDADRGEDRIVKRARLEQIEPMEVVQRYTIDFHNVLTQLNCLPPSIEPTATGHIVEQIAIIQKIIAKGLAYQVNGSVYFDVIKYNNSNKYGLLSHRNIEDLIHNTRDLEGVSDKKNPQDFALWKKAEPQHIMRWQSPWGYGFPGWHLECTAMSTKYLGKNFDIHGGGMDLKFPHHECEIAQAKVSNGNNPVKYWIHTNMLTLNGKKMAKSTGNNILPSDIFSGENKILEKSFSPVTIRFFMQQAHYRSILDFSNDAVLASEKGCNRLMDSISLLKHLPVSMTSDINISLMINKCYDCMNDDFNTPLLIAQLFDISKVIHQIRDGKLNINHKDLELLTSHVEAFVYDVLGLQKPTQNHLDRLPKVVEVLIKLRNKARDDKDFKTSDFIREKLEELGIQLKDGKDSTTFSIV